MSINKFEENISSVMNDKIIQPIHEEDEEKLLELRLLKYDSIIHTLMEMVKETGSDDKVRLIDISS